MQIAMIGLAGAGKDTSALILQRVLKERGMDFIIDRYAAPLKRAAREVFGKDFDERDIKEVRKSIGQDRIIEATFRCLNVLGFDDAEHDKASHLFFEHMPLSRPISPREYQQILGTEVVRAVRPTAWVDRIRSIKTKNVIISDARFENELCFKNILVRRFENIDKPKHPSEHLAWDLQFTGKVLPVDVFDLDNHRPTTLHELEDRIRFIVDIMSFNDLI